MDIGKIKEYSDLAHDLALTKKNALEKCRANQIFAYNGKLFKADAETINLVSTLKSYSETFTILDTNQNPCQIENPDNFLEVLIQKNQESLNAYRKLLEQLKRR